MEDKLAQLRAFERSIVESLQSDTAYSHSSIGEDDREEIKLEMGDIVWYLTQIATGLGIDLSEILQANIGKITDRQRRGVIGGNGDKRAVTVRKLKECIEHNAGGIWAGSVKVKLLQDALELIDK